MKCPFATEMAEKEKKNLANNIAMSQISKWGQYRKVYSQYKRIHLYRGGFLEYFAIISICLRRCDASVSKLEKNWFTTLF